jgi:hypothetical protein
MFLLLITTLQSKLSKTVPFANFKNLVLVLDTYIFRKFLIRHLQGIELALSQNVAKVQDIGFPVKRGQRSP